MCVCVCENKEWTSTTQVSSSSPLSLYPLKVLESGKFLSRKTIVLYVVQQLQQDFPQASKTCVGHVVQLLYRASCFNVSGGGQSDVHVTLSQAFPTL